MSSNAPVVSIVPYYDNNIGTLKTSMDINGIQLIPIRMNHIVIGNQSQQLNSSIYTGMFQWSIVVSKYHLDYNSSSTSEAMG